MIQSGATEVAAQNWAPIVSVVSTVLCAIMVWLIKRDFKSDYPSVDAFKALENRLDELKEIFANQDKNARESAQAEVNRVHKSFTDMANSIRSDSRIDEESAARRATEIREMIRKVDAALELLKDQNKDIAHRFELHKRDYEHEMDRIFEALDLKRRNREDAS